jgi:hypothetical protein
MNEHLKERILRAAESLSDERGYQILDYIEFLNSKYAERANPTNLFAKITERAGKVPIDAITGTVTFFDGASKVMKGLASAAQAVVDEASKTAQSITSSKPESADKTPPPVTPPTSNGNTP